MKKWIGWNFKEGYNKIIYGDYQFIIKLCKDEIKSIYYIGGWISIPNGLKNDDEFYDKLNEIINIIEEKYI